MASSEEYKKLYELYQVEGVPKGISIVDFCQRNGFVYKQFEHSDLIVEGLLGGDFKTYKDSRTR